MSISPTIQSLEDKLTDPEAKIEILERKHSNNLNAQLFNICDIGNKIRNDYSYLEFPMEEQLFDEFKKCITNFILEEKYIEMFLKHDKDFLDFLQNEEEKAKYLEKATMQNESELEKQNNYYLEQFQSINTLTNSNTINNVSEIFHNFEGFDKTREKQFQASHMMKKLKELASDCLYLHQKSNALQSKLESLKIRGKQESEHCRLSYQFIESTSRFKISSYDGKRLSGCILPQKSTLNNSHIFEIYLEENLGRISDWLWERIYTFSIPTNLQSKFSKDQAINIL